MRKLLFLLILGGSLKGQTVAVPLVQTAPTVILPICTAATYGLCKLQAIPAAPALPALSKVATSGLLSDAIGLLLSTRIAADPSENSYLIFGPGTNGDTSSNAPQPTAGAAVLRYFNFCPVQGTVGPCLAGSFNAAPWKVVLQ